MVSQEITSYYQVSSAAVQEQVLSLLSDRMMARAYEASVLSIDSSELFFLEIVDRFGLAYKVMEAISSELESQGTINHLEEKPTVDFAEKSIQIDSAMKIVKEARKIGSFTFLIDNYLIKIAGQDYIESRLNDTLYIESLGIKKSTLKRRIRSACRALMAIQINLHQQCGVLTLTPEVVAVLLNKKYYHSFRDVVNGIKNIPEKGDQYYSLFSSPRGSLGDEIFEQLREMVAYIVTTNSEK